MPVVVKTFATPAEASSALASDRSARFIGGGTLVMRALNEGDVGISTIVRLEERALSQIRTMGARVTIGAGVTLNQILRERDLAFLHAPARSIGGPAVRTMATVGGNLFAPSPYGDLTVALLALDATVSVMSGYGARDMALEEFLAGRDRAAGAIVLSVSCDRPPNPEAFRYRKVARVKPKGVSVLSIAAICSGGRRTRVRGPHRLWRHGADRDPRQGRRARARRPDAGRIGRRRRGRGRRRGNLPGHGRDRQRLVSARGRGRASAPPAPWA